MSHKPKHRMEKSEDRYREVMRSKLSRAERRERVEAIMHQLCREGYAVVARAFVDHLERAVERGVDGIEAHYALLRVLARDGQIADAREEACRFETARPFGERPPYAHPVFGFIEIAAARKDDAQVHFAYSVALRMQDWEAGDRVNALVQIARRFNHPLAMEYALREAQACESRGDWNAASEACRLIAHNSPGLEYWIRACELAEKLDDPLRTQRLARIARDLRRKRHKDLLPSIVCVLPEEGTARQKLLEPRPSLPPPSLPPFSGPCST